ncbi:GPI anchored serine-threonine rich family protein, partial [Aspergillus ibericus CBS 121593]
MRFSYAVSLLPLAAFVGALEVTSPTKGEDVDLSKSFTVKWDSVSTDPSTFDLYLVNNAVYPTVEQKIASDVDTSSGSYTVSGLSGVSDGSGYQINLLSTSTQNSGILAQSQQFNVEGSSSATTSSSSSSSTSSASSSSGTTTATTISTTGTSSSSSTGTAATTSSSSIGSSTTGLTSSSSAANTLSTTGS